MAPRRTPVKAPLQDCSNQLRRSPRLTKTTSVLNTTSTLQTPSFPSFKNPATHPIALFPSEDGSNPSENATAVALFVSSPTPPAGGATDMTANITTVAASGNPLTTQVPSLLPPADCLHDCNAAEINNEPGAVIIDTSIDVNDIDKVFSFLSSFNKAKLRKLCKGWKCRNSGNKPDLLHRALRYVKKLIVAEKDFTSLLNSAVGNQGYTKFLEDCEATLIDSSTAPSEEVMVNHLKEIGDKIVDTSDAVHENRDPNFTISEFARLVVVMRDDERAKAALFGLSQPLDRLSLDAGRGKDAYWNIIAQRFNNPAVPARFDFRGTLDNVDPTTPPVCRQSGAVLKDQWHKARHEFTRTHKNWEASGQNDPDRFVNFLATSADGSLTAASERALIIFVCAGLGTPYRNDLLFHSATKMIPAGGGTESGMPGNEVEAEDEIENRAVKRRKKGSDSLQDNVHDINQNIERVESILASCIQASVNTNGQSQPVPERMDVKSEEKEGFKDIIETFNDLQHVKKHCTGRIVEIAEARHQKAIQDYDQTVRNRQNTIHSTEYTRD